MSIKIGDCAAKEKTPCDYLVIAFTEKQAYQLFFKTLMYIEEKYSYLLTKKGKDKPTKHEIKLKNGVVIRCYAAGITGAGLRGFTIKKLFIDEAAPMAREIFASVSPMISVTGGTIDISSTPQGKQGFF
jgi:intein/homing endonuclease